MLVPELIGPFMSFLHLCCFAVGFLTTEKTSRVMAVLVRVVARQPGVCRPKNGCGIASQCGSCDTKDSWAIHRRREIAKFAV